MISGDLQRQLDATARARYEASAQQLQSWDTLTEEQKSYWRLVVISESPAQSSVRKVEIDGVIIVGPEA